MSKTKSSDPEFAVWSRRQFAKAIALGSGAVLLPSLASSRMARADAPVKKSVDPTAKTDEEKELDELAKTAPHLHAIAMDTLAQLKYAFTIAAAGKATAGHEFTDAFKPWINARKPKAKQSYNQMATALLAAPIAQRQAVFAHYATVAPAQFSGTKTTALPKMAKASSPASLEHLAAISLPSSSVTNKGDDDDKKPEKGKDNDKDKKDSKDVTEGKKYKQLEFFISEIKSIENSGGLFEGDNEIAAGGAAVGATGAIEKIKQFKVMDGFDSDSSSHDKKVYKGGKRFAVLSTHPDLKLPHEVLVTVSLAEKDDGGFGDFLAKLWDEVKTYVKVALVAGGGAIAGALSLSWIPGIGPLIGAIIGALIGWLVSLFHNDDDIVGVRTAALRLHHVSKSYYDRVGLTKPSGIPVSMDFHRDGHYRLTGGWRLVNP